MPNLPKASLRIKRFKSVVEDKMLGYKFIKGHEDYQRFVILARPRTGSNLLVSLLQSHQNLRLFYELFNTSLSEKTFWDFINYKIDDVYEQKKEDSVGFLEDFVYREMPKSVKGVGFKLFYTHAKDENESHVWPYLEKSKHLKIIHLKRKNLLKTHLSQEVALKTQVWVGKKTPSQIYPIELDYNQALKCFNDIHQKEKEYSEFFSQHCVFDLYYEDLVKDIEHYSEELQKFLQIEYQPLYASTPKQSSRPLSEAISNYFELKEKFSGSPWSKYFLV